MSSQQLPFSILILSYNTSAVLKNCLDSIYKHTKIKFEVVIVDHNSTDGSVAMLKKYSQKHQNLKLILKKDNPGFGSGQNNAAKVAQGKYLLLLNSDTIFTYDILNSIYTKLEKSKNVGIYSVKLTNNDGSFQGSGGSFPGIFNLILWQFALDDIPLLSNFLPSFHPKEKSTIYKKGPDWVTGAFMIIPKALYKTVGGFDEEIFMYTEEMELAYRISKLGKKVIYDSQESIIHLGGASGGSYLAITNEIKYLIYFWQKHKPTWQLLLVRIILFFGSLLRLLFFGIIKQNDIYKRAYTDSLKYTF